jgi:hypothetical protein
MTATTRLGESRRTWRRRQRVSVRAAGLGGGPVEAELGGGGPVEAGLGSGARDWIEDDGRPRKKMTASSERRQMRATEQDVGDWIPTVEATTAEKKPT